MKFIERFNKFDTASNFRLKNAFIFAISINLIAPVLISLKGIYLLPWVISVFLILEALAVKTNSYFVNLSLDTLYKIGTTLNIILLFSASLYFFSPELMVYSFMIFSLFEIAIFSSYSIKLNNYIAENYISSMSSFQITRNSIWADGILIGLISSTLILMISTKAAIISFIIFNTLYAGWLLLNWNFYRKDYDVA